jgi:hypothetical protein
MQALGFKKKKFDHTVWFFHAPQADERHCLRDFDEFVCMNHGKAQAAS